MLFLEFIRDYYKDFKNKISFTIREAGETNIAEEGFFYIRMDCQLRETYADAVSYINENLPIEA
jgi:hypothetical protein